MRAVLHLDDTTAALPMAGRDLRAHLHAVLVEAGFQVVDDAGEDLALHVQGRFAAVRPQTLARLRLPGDAVCTPDGRTIAAVGHGSSALSAVSGELASREEAHDAGTLAGRSRAERAVRVRNAYALEDAGVQVVDPERLVVDSTVRVEPGATLWPEVVLLGTTRIAAGAEVRPGCWLEDTTVAAGALIKPHCVCTHAHIGPGSQVGPMAHLRPQAVLAGDNRVGNFVEVKKTTMHPGSKASHLTYLGDADIGAKANIGAGTITCNYDGFRKHRTVVGEGAFVGSNSSLVAPIHIGAGAVVGAGSALSKDVPDDALAVVRADTRILPGKGKRLNERNARLKARELARKDEPG